MDFFEKVFEYVMTGGPNAIIALLVLIIFGLIMDRKNLRDDIKRKEERLDKIVDDYHQGNLTIAEAMNSLKYVLAEIKGKIGG